MVNCKHFLLARNSSYEFSHWKKEDLRSDIGVMRLAVEDDLYTNPWHEILSFFHSRVWIKLRSSYCLFLFLSSEIWMLDTRANRYYGLWKKLSKDHSVLFDSRIVSESCHERDKKIRFSGIMHIQDIDIDLLRDFYLNQQVGLFFALKNPDERILKNIECEIFGRAIELPGHRMEHMMNIPRAINIIVDFTGIAIFPNGSEDFGGVYLDIFCDSGLLSTIEGCVRRV